MTSTVKNKPNHDRFRARVKVDVPAITKRKLKELSVATGVPMVVFLEELVNQRYAMYLKDRAASAPASIILCIGSFGAWREFIAALRAEGRIKWCTRKWVTDQYATSIHNERFIHVTRSDQILECAPELPAYLLLSDPSDTLVQTLMNCQYNGREIKPWIKS